MSDETTPMVGISPADWMRMDLRFFWNEKDRDKADRFFDMFAKFFVIERDE